MAVSLSIEFGAFDGGYSQDPCPQMIVDEMGKVQDKVRGDFGDDVSLTLMPYEGERGLWGGGRPTSPSEDVLRESIDVFNKAGAPFMIAMNGGLGLPRESVVDLSLSQFRTEKALLEALQEGGRVNSVKNWVTVLNDGLAAAVKRDYPDIGIIKSCIAFTGGREGEFRGREEYSEAFRGYERVVPLNQHTTPEFLREWIRKAHKMVLLLNSRCDASDLHQCFAHYQQLDAPHLFAVLQIDEDRKGRGGRFTSLPNSEFPATPGCGDKNRGELTRRPDELKEFMRWGVRHFKMGREGHQRHMNPDYISQLVRMSLEANGVAC